jgi:hypothetical protein
MTAEAKQAPGAPFLLDSWILVEKWAMAAQISVSPKHRRPDEIFLRTGTADCRVAFGAGVPNRLASSALTLQYHKFSLF